MGNKGDKNNTLMGSQEKSVTMSMTMTHDTLYKALIEIVKNPDKVVLITRSGQGKPRVYWNKDLTAGNYMEQPDRIGYITKVTGYEKDNRVLTITRKVIEMYEDRYDTHSIMTIEKEIYNWAINKNKLLNLQRNY